jgi:pimeloyl-ACP methyl ester carboxylesterase
MRRESHTLLGGIGGSASHTVAHSIALDATVTAAPLPSSSASGAIQYHIIIVPGNPGTAELYAPFALGMHRLLRGRVAVRAVALAGFDPHPTSAAAAQEGERLYSLQEQCEYLHQYLTVLHAQLRREDEAVASACGTPSSHSIAQWNAARASGSHSPPQREHRFILACHSIGAHIGIAAMASAAAEQRAHAARTAEATAAGSPSALHSSSHPVPHRISHSYMLFPFIRMDLTPPHLRLVSFLLRLRFLGVAGLIARMLALVPLAVIRAVLRWMMSITSEHAVLAIASTFSSMRLANQSAHLGADEMVHVRRPGDVAHLALLEQHKQRMTLYYAPDDVWAPRSQMHALQVAVPGLDARFVPDASHAWCAFRGQSEMMARLIARQIDERIHQDACAEKLQGQSRPQLQAPQVSASASLLLDQAAPLSMHASVGNDQAERITSRL